MYINISKVDFGGCKCEVVPQLNGLYITPASNSSINVTSNSNYYDLHGKYLKYSFDGKKWKKWNGNVTIEPEQKMYLKGEDDYVWNSSTSGNIITSDGYYNVGGDISSLTNFITEVKTYTFKSLFDGDSYIKDASNLILPATTLNAECYQYMFNGCTSLTLAPALPATTLASNCYEHMFQGCTSLTAAPELPATSLASNCYYGMFSSCTSLTTAPALPSTTLASWCYAYMFSSCTSLTNAPELHATKLESRCYQYMFSGCTSLTTAPELPATSLADGCYYYMFNGCTSLTTAPELPATKVYDGSYKSMFSGCTSLTTAPAMHATTLDRYCCSEMFRGCTSLTTAPALPATTLHDGCYYKMFMDCTELTTAPELPANTLGRSCYYEMFNNCTSLTTAPELPAATLVSGCYERMFFYCSKLNNITMLATEISASSCLSRWVEGVAPTGTFTKAASMTSLPTGNNGIPSGWTVKDYGVVDYSQEYMTLSALGDGEITITIPAGVDSTYATSLSYSKDKANWTDTIIDNTAQTITIPVTNGDNVYLKGIAKKLGKDNNNYVNINSTADINASGNTMSLLYGDDYKDKVAFQSGSEYTFNSLFSGNTHLINSNDLILPATKLTPRCYWFMFKGCTSLTTAPALPATTLAQYCYSSLFNGCTSLTAAPELPATELVSSCYFYMFKGCTSLTTAPELPATTLKDECYSNMFQGCASLNNIIMLATYIPSSNCMYNWVNGVAPTGTFTKSPEMTTLSTGVNGIPSGWTVVDYGAA